MTKFDSPLARELWEVSLEGVGWTSEEIGSVNELGWYGFFDLNSCGPYLSDSLHARYHQAAILKNDSLGFVTTELFIDDSEARDRWLEITEDYYSYWDELDSG